MKATPVYLRCPKRVRIKGANKTRACGQPLTKTNEDKQGLVKMMCPDGHTKYYCQIYASRFSFASLNPDQHHPPEPPAVCPGCGIALITMRLDQRLGIIECGNCGLRLTFNEKRQEWEQAPIG